MPLDASAENVQSCQFAEPDLLGLGVRIGSYLQYVATLRTQVNGTSGTLPGLAETNTVTLAAVLAILFIRLHQHRLASAEVVALFYLLQALVRCSTGRCMLACLERIKSPGALVWVRQLVAVPDGVDV